MPYDTLSVKNMLKHVENPEKFYEICHNEILNNQAIRKKKYICRNNKSFMTKHFQELLCKEHVLDSNF